MNNPQPLIRPLVRELHPCVYGEQPRTKGLIKPNTNENPYPPSPKVLAEALAAVNTIPPRAKPCSRGLTTQEIQSEICRTKKPKLQTTP